MKFRQIAIAAALVGLMCSQGGLAFAELVATPLQGDMFEQEVVRPSRQ